VVLQRIEWKSFLKGRKSEVACLTASRRQGRPKKVPIRDLAILSEIYEVWQLVNKFLLSKINEVFREAYDTSASPSALLPSSDFRQKISIKITVVP